ncbi:NADPH-dependent diflavin oxidoreductase 1 isoform X1 [Senna tora]|uniref:NADPH-dependent diflavin oxidoreductase 1 isoform X1 n=1 Tax=Senna tora TaxID=362788 RepID=A0A834TFA4_9FABA|nr:NADPH-dependent diflavin oxidoreductase 1 isoform X1 [Senna tora]
MEDKPKLLILYATQTGNALDAAEQLGREAERRGCPVKLHSMDEYDPSLLSKEEAMVFVVSTTGQGDTPDSMKVFWRYLLQKSLSKHWLNGVPYAVFGLGDSSYQKYNFVAKKLDKRLMDLGGTVILERGLGDDQHPSGYEGALDPWMSSLWRVLSEIKPKLIPNGTDFMIPDATLIDKSKVQITYHNTGHVDSPFSTSSDLIYNDIQIGSARSMHPGTSYPDRSRPGCFLKMKSHFSCHVKNLPLTRSNCGKDARHFEFEFVSSAIEYDTGDVLEILPSQDSAAVDAFIQRCKLNPDSFITVSPREMDNQSERASMIPVKLKTFVELTMDVASASPRRNFIFKVMSFFATAEHEIERLKYFASPEGRDDLYKYNQKERRTILEVKITEHKLTPSNFLEWAKTIRIYLQSIDKEDHLDDPPLDGTKKAWLKDDQRLFLLIRNTISPEVLRYVTHCDLVKELMDYLAFVYSGKGNLSYTYDVCKAFYRPEKLDKSLVTYFMEFKKAYEELNTLLPYTADIKVQMKQREQMAIMSWISGLPSEYEGAKQQILAGTEVTSLMEIT